METILYVGMYTEYTLYNPQVHYYASLFRYVSPFMDNNNNLYGSIIES